MGQGREVERWRAVGALAAAMVVVLAACGAPTEDGGAFGDSLRPSTTRAAAPTTSTTGVPTSTTVTLPPPTTAPTTTTAAPPPPPPPPPGPAIPAGDDATVTRVTDGDTIVVNGDTKVRLIGVDTPEVYFGAQCWGSNASGWTKAALPSGTRVRLEYDNNRTDRYGRTLAYVHRLPDGLNVNVALLQLGLAAAYPFADTPRYHAWFAAEATRAKAAGAGGWRECAGRDGPLSGPAVK
jgi:endonuclease YncB( thermonuclease family)